MSSPIKHPSISQHIGMLLEDFGIADIAEPENAHIPFEQAMNGFGLGFPIPDWVMYSALVASIMYYAFLTRLI